MRAIISRFGRIVFALVGWIALLTASAGKASSSDDWIVLPDFGGLLFLAAAIAAVVGALIISFRGSPPSARQGQTRRVPAWAGLLALLLVVLVLFVMAPRDPFLEDSLPDIDPSLQAQLEDRATAEQPGAVTGEQTGGTADEQTDGATAGDIAVLLAIAAAALLVLRRTGFSTGTGEPHPADPLAPKLGRALDDAAEQLNLADDPRGGVMAAYAALEGALAKQRSDRRPTETPSEHMARALAAFPIIKRPAVQLAHLYELARFSDYPIEATDRDRAAAALDEARLSLTAAAPDPP